VKQSEREKHYDAVLKVLNKKGLKLSIDDITKRSSDFYDGRHEVVRELKSKGLVTEHVSEKEVQLGIGFKKPPYIEKEYSYSIHDNGRELVRKGGFRKKWWLNLLSNWERVLVLFFMATSTFFAIPYFSTENTPIPDNKTTGREEQSLSKSDTLETDSAHLKNDTTN